MYQEVDVNRSFKVLLRCFPIEKFSRNFFQLPLSVYACPARCRSFPTPINHSMAITVCVTTGLESQPPLSCYSCLGMCLFPATQNLLVQSTASSEGARNDVHPVKPHLTSIARTTDEFLVFRCSPPEAEISSNHDIFCSSITRISSIRFCFPVRRAAQTAHLYLLLLLWNSTNSVSFSQRFRTIYVVHHVQLHKVDT